MELEFTTEDQRIRDDLRLQGPNVPFTDPPNISESVRVAREELRATVAADEWDFGALRMRLLNGRRAGVA